MEKHEIIKYLKQNADFFTKEEIIKIIELTSQAHFMKNPFSNEEEIAENSLKSVMETLAKYDREIIQRAKQKITELIP
jgi:hypothetical protein